MIEIFTYLCYNYYGFCIHRQNGCFENESTDERRRNAVQLYYGVPEDIEKWMSLVTRVRWNFPGLETQEKLNEHRATVLKFMGKRQAICVKKANEITGVMLFSRGHNMIFCLAVAPE